MIKKSRSTGTPKRRERDWNFAAPVLEQLQSFFLQHGIHCLGRLRAMTATPVSSAMTVLVMAIALAIPSGFLLLVKNAELASGGLEVTNQISVFLKTETIPDLAGKITTRLQEHPQIRAARLISKEEGLQELKTYSGFGQVLEALDFNPLPMVIHIEPKDSLTKPEDVQALVAELKEIREADFVQADTQWMRKLAAMLSIARRSLVMLGSLLSLAVLFIVGNTIRLELHSRRDEISVSRLLGATDGFIRRPFLYTGFWYGLSSGVLAWLLVAILILVLNGPVEQLTEQFGGQFGLSFLSLKESLQLLGIGTALSLAGSWAVVTHHLRKL
jgi:cell division transport system permease protein